MIRIQRPVAVPNRLTVEGAAADQKNRDDFDRSPQTYINLLVEFDIHNSIYGHPTVKTSLREAQFGKCCFCEKDQREEDGAVEHFRPKKGYIEKRGLKMVKPGYFWLGYDWENFLFCCKKCNGSKCKGNLFPLRPGSTRARSHNNNLALEDPYLIDPATIDPSLHLYFDNEFIKFSSDYGQETIYVLRLDRPELTDFRSEHIVGLKMAIIILKTFPAQSQDAQDAKQFLRRAREPYSKFSACAKTFIDNSGVDLS